MAELTGHGTLYDMDDTEIGAVVYRVVRSPVADSSGWDWGGELAFEDEDAMPPPGRYVLEAEDGTRGELEIEPPGATSGGSRHVAIRGIGVFRPQT